MKLGESNVQDNVICEVKGSVAKIILNRPEALNAINPNMGFELVKTIEKCFDPAIRLVILTGAEKAFCSGGDLQEMKTAGVDKLPEFLQQLTKLLHRVITDIRLLPKPVIAAINGSLGGAGFSLALACDLRYAVSDAKFKQSYTSVGLCPDGGFTAFLPAITGFGKAAELLYLDPVFDALSAKEWGIVHDVFTQDEFADRVMEIAEKLALGPTVSFAKSKELLNEAFFPVLEKQLELERQKIISLAKTKDATAGINAFFAKVKAEYTGE